jgi:hypothetical protein
MIAGLIMLAIILPVSAISQTPPLSDFNDGTLQGWTKVPPYHGELLNPGTYLMATDSIAGGGSHIVRAPYIYSEDIILYKGISWDEYIYSNNPDPIYSTIPWLILIDGIDTTIYLARDSLVGAVSQWRSRFIPFKAAAWTRIMGSADFDSVISNLSELWIRMEASLSAEGPESAIDNVTYLIADEDGDGIANDVDECTDSDDDGYGNPGFGANICADDNCPFTYNPGQEDFDGDGIGNVCDYPAEWVANRGYLPDGICPEWLLTDNADPEDPLINDDSELVLATSSLSETMYRIRLLSNLL